jgi:hypothetical protein
MNTEAPTPQTREDTDSKRNTLYKKINTIKGLIKFTEVMSGVSISEGGISHDKANKTIQLFEKDISKLEQELRELESEPNNTAINTTSEKSIDKEFVETLEERHTEAIEESNKNSPEILSTTSMLIFTIILLILVIIIGVCLILAIQYLEGL